MGGKEEIFDKNMFSLAYFSIMINSDFGRLFLKFSGGRNTVILYLPLLFVIVIKALSKMLDQYKFENLIRGFNIKNPDKEINHIQFNDNSKILRLR